MAATVVRFTQALLVRPHLSPRGLYNGIVFLNQIYLTGNEGNSTGSTSGNKNSGKNGKGTGGSSSSSGGNSSGSSGSSSLAESLMATYLGLFQRAVDGGELKSRLLAALLTGVARAQPYLSPTAWKGTSSSSSSADASGSGKNNKGASSGGGVLGEHIDTIFKIVHTGSFHASTQALSILLFFVTQQQQREARKGLSSSSGGSAGGKGAGKGGKGKGKGGKGGASSTSADGASAGTGEAGSTTAPLVDRFYRALYAALGAGHLAATSKPTLFLNLIFKVCFLLFLIKFLFSAICWVLLFSYVTMIEHARSSSLVVPSCF